MPGHEPHPWMVPEHPCQTSAAHQESATPQHATGDEAPAPLVLPSILRVRSVDWAALLLGRPSQLGRSVWVWRLCSGGLRCISSRKPHRQTGHVDEGWYMVFARIVRGLRQEPGSHAASTPVWWSEPARVTALESTQRWRWSTWKRIVLLSCATVT